MAKHQVILWVLAAVLLLAVAPSISAEEVAFGTDTSCSVYHGLGEYSWAQTFAFTNYTAINGYRFYVNGSSNTPPATVPVRITNTTAGNPVWDEFYEEVNVTVANDAWNEVTFSGFTLPNGTYAVVMEGDGNGLSNYWFMCVQSDSYGAGFLHYTNAIPPSSWSDDSGYDVVGSLFYNITSAPVVNYTINLTDGLVAYFPLDELSSPTVSDLVNGVTGLTSEPVVPGILGNARNMTQSLEGINITSTFGLNYTVNRTYNFWVNLDGRSDWPGGNSDYWLVSFIGDPAYPGAQMITHEMKDFGATQGVSWQGGNPYDFSTGEYFMTGAIASGWHMVTYTTTLGGTADAYFDGVYVGSYSEVTSPAERNRSQVIYLGNAFPPFSDNTTALSGLVDEFGMWSRGLNQGEISALWANGTAYNLSADIPPYVPPIPYAYNDHGFPCDGGTTAQSTEGGAWVTFNQSIVLHGINTTASGYPVTPRDTWFVFEFDPATNGVTLLRNGSFGGEYTVTWDDNDTILYSGRDYIIYTNSTASELTCYVNGVNGGHNQTIGMAGLDVHWMFRTAHLPPQITQTNGVYGQLQGLFFTLSNATLPAPVTAERMWYRGDYGTVDYGLLGNNIGDTVGTPSLTASNAKIYNVSYQTAATSCFYNSSATTFSGDANESVCFWAYPTDDMTAANDWFVLSLATWGSFYEGNLFGFETGQIGLFHNGDNAYQAATLTQNSWQHFCIVYDSIGNGADFYRDGLFLGRQNFTNSVNYGANKVILGGFDGGGMCTGNGFAGQLQDVRVYDIVLNQSQVDFLYNSGAGTDQPLNYSSPLPPPPGPFPLNGTDPRTIRPSNLVHYWGMNQTGTQNIIDEGTVPIPLQNTNGTFQTEYTDAYVLITNSTYLRNLTDPGTRNFTTDGYYGSVNWTMSLRLRLDRLKDGSDGNTEQHVTFAEDDGGAYLMYQNAYCLGDTYDVILFGSNTSSYTGPCYGDAGFNDSHVYLGEPPAVGEWRTITVTHDDTGLYSVYINGILNATQQEAANSMLQPHYSTDALYGVELSGYSENEAIWQINGGLQRVAFWNAALNVSEVWSLAQNGEYVYPPVVRDPVLLSHNGTFGGVNWGGVNNQELAARLVFTGYHNVTSAAIIRGAVSSPVGEYNMTLQTDNSEAPSGTLACAGAYKTFTASEIGTGPSETEYFFNFTAPCEVSPGVYWLVYGTNDTSGSVEASIDSGVGSQSPVEVQYRQNAGSWLTGLSNHMMNYFVYGLNVSAPPVPSSCNVSIVNATEYSWYDAEWGVCDVGVVGNNLENSSNVVYNTTNYKVGGSSFHYLTATGALMNLTLAQSWSAGSGLPNSFFTWVYYTNAPSSGEAIFYGGTDYSGSPGNHVWNYKFANATAVSVNYYAENPFVDIGFTPGTWTHIGYVFGRAGDNITFYKDGVAVETVTQNNPASTSGNAFILGAYFDGNAGTADKFYDDVRFYNHTITDEEVAFIYNGGNGTNQSLSEYVPLVPCVETIDGNYTVVTCTGNGSFVPTYNGTVELLLVAGGGAGGPTSTGNSGGGGAGGLKYFSAYSVSTLTNYSVVVGLGGSPGGYGTAAANGGATMFGIESATGGGQGGTWDTLSCDIGGSGGGGAQTSGLGCSGIPGQGNAGGRSGIPDGYGGGGGGGAGQNGSDSHGTNEACGGDGGDGLEYSLSGVATYYAGGGGGSSHSSCSYLPAGGLGGGGSGHYDTNAATSGLAGTGGGGGAGGETYAAGSGGSGVVVIRYLTIPPPVVVPDSVTGLSSTNQTNETITWAWTNPGGSFDHAVLLLDGLNTVNTSSSSHQFTGLAANTSYTLTVWTADSSGNTNSTNVSDTNMTLETYVPPVPTAISAISCETTYPYVGDVPMAQMPVNFTVTDESVSGSAGSVRFDGVPGTCAETVVNATTLTYACLVNVSILQAQGTYPVNVTYTDSNDYVSDSSTMCTIGGVMAYARVGDSVSFSGAGPGLVNVSGDSSVALQNTGNLPLGIYMTAFDLIGRSQPGVTLPASAFRTGTSLPTSVQMAHGVQENMSVTVAPAQNSSMLFWLSMPSNQLIQDYYAATPWQIIGVP